MIGRPDQVDVIARDDARQSPGELLERLAQFPV
jgi:hypothetical protein